MIPRFKVRVKKRDGTTAIEDAVLDQRDYYATARGSLPTAPIEGERVVFGVECPGGYKILKGRQGAHTFESHVDFDLSGEPQKPRSTKCPIHGTNVKYTTPVEINPNGPPHRVRFKGHVPDKIIGNKKVRLRLEY